MKRHPPILSQVVLRCWTLAITLVIGFQFGPQLFAHRAPSPVVCRADQDVFEDTFNAEQRLERRVVRASIFDRLAPVHPACRTGADEARTLAALAFDGRSDVERLPIVKHVPRMERGDPPRT